VRVESLGFRTDLAVHALGGAKIEERDDCIVVRTPANPGYLWGNFVLLPGPVAPGQAPRLQTMFAAEFPWAAHLALGIDGTNGDFGDAGVVEELGVTVAVNAVLTARSLQAPARADREPIVRRLVDDDDWEQAVALRLAVYEPEDVRGERQFVSRHLAASRVICERGDGAWFGAFAQGRLVAALGLLRASPSTARYQSVETLASHRRRGLASRLLYESCGWARDALGAREFVIVADPEYHAIEAYRRLGFAAVERQAQLERAPAEA
jgi:GNAT superfamily N-acetyltransferase